MKLMIASDIHGSAYFARLIEERYREEKADKLLLLGDILYHGPRNDLPKEYSPRDVASVLNSIKEEILCVQGNCDADVDQLVLEFPIKAEYCILYHEGTMIFVTHGHVYNRDNPPMLKSGDILLHGHTHVPTWEPFGEKNNYCLNPGSVSLPKDGTNYSYMTFEGGLFLWKDILTGEIYHSLKI